MDEHKYKRHNKSLLLYHLVFPVKYRRKAITEEVCKTLKEVCDGIEERYEIKFIEIGTDKDHVHFLVQGIPDMSVRTIVQTVKSITAREILSKHKEIKKILWGGKFWTSGYYANTVGLYANKDVIAKYVKEQGMEYQKLHENQLKLF